MKKSMKINKRKKSSFRRKDKNLRKKTIKKYHKKSIAKGKKQKGGIELARVDQTTQPTGSSSSANSVIEKKYKGGKRRKEIQNMFLKANKFANKYIETNIERVSSGGNYSSKIQSGGIRFGNMFNPKSEDTIKMEEQYKKMDKNDVESKENEDAEEENEDAEEENEDAEEEKPSRMSKFTNFMTRKKKEDPIEPDLSEHDSAVDNKIMINKEKDKYVWIRVNIPSDKNVLVQSDTSGTLEETLKTFKELPAE